MHTQKIEPFILVGVFFQPGIALSIGHDAEGARACVRKIVNQTLFTAVFNFDDPERTTNGVGQMTDHYGYALITNIELTQDKLTFTKQYHDRTDTIKYSFARRGDFWVGEYAGARVGTGNANCIVHKTVQELFVNQQATSSIE